MNGWMDGLMDEWKDGCMGRCLDEQMDGWIDRQVDGWIEQKTENREEGIKGQKQETNHKKKGLLFNALAVRKSVPCPIV